MIFQSHSSEYEVKHDEISLSGNLGEVKTVISLDRTKPERPSPTKSPLILPANVSNKVPWSFPVFQNPIT